MLKNATQRSNEYFSFLHTKKFQLLNFYLRLLVKKKARKLTVFAEIIVRPFSSFILSGTVLLYHVIFAAGRAPRTCWIEWHTQLLARNCNQQRKNNYIEDGEIIYRNDENIKGQQSKKKKTTSVKWCRWKSCESKKCSYRCQT